MRGGFVHASGENSAGKAFLDRIAAETSAIP